MGSDHSESDSSSGDREETARRDDWEIYHEPPGIFNVKRQNAKLRVRILEYFLTLTWKPLGRGILPQHLR